MSSKFRQEVVYDHNGQCIVPKTRAFYCARQSLCLICTGKPYGVNYLARYSLCGMPH